jgi:CheY-like chemotaxis protein
MDIQMPVMDGFQTTYEIRKWEKQIRESSSLLKMRSPKPVNKPIPIIAMTAHAMIGDREKCLESGMNDYLPKPVDPEKLFTTLALWIEPKQRSIPKYLVAKTTMNYKDVENQPLIELPGISVKSGLTKVGGNWKIYRKLLAKFAKHYVSVTEDIRNAITSSDIKTATRLVHTLKGLAGNIGAHNLYNSAVELETLMAKNNFDNLDKQLNAFSDALAIVVKAIHQFQYQESDKTSIAPSVGINDKLINTDRLISLLKELRHLLEENDFHAVKLYDTIKEIAPSKFQSDEFIDLGIHIEGYAYEKALKVLSIIEKTIINQVK